MARVFTEEGPGQETEAIEIARSFLDSGVPMVVICGATVGLARGGLLDHRKHTGNSPDYLAVAGYGGASLYQDVPAFTDDNVITASGVRPSICRAELQATGSFTSPKPWLPGPDSSRPGAPSILKH